MTSAPLSDCSYTLLFILTTQQAQSPVFALVKDSDPQSNFSCLFNHQRNIFLPFFSAMNIMPPKKGKENYLLTLISGCSYYNIKQKLKRTVQTTLRPVSLFF